MFVGFRCWYSEGGKNYGEHGPMEQFVRYVWSLQWLHLQKQGEEEKNPTQIKYLLYILSQQIHLFQVWKKVAHFFF